MPLVVGVDAARRAGWIAVAVQDGHLHALRRHRTLDEVLSEWAEAEVFAVDLPLGHEDPDGAQGAVRQADLRARALLGPHAERHPLVPPLRLLDPPRLDVAVLEARRRGFPEPNEALWNVRDRVLELQAAAARDPRWHEAHAEVSLQVMKTTLDGTGHVEAHRRSMRGIHERLALLHRVGLRPMRSFGGVGRANPDDVLEATALAWTAGRLQNQEAVVLPETPPVDAFSGRPVAIHA